MDYFFGSREHTLTPAAQSFVNSLPPVFINLFRKKRRLLPIWSSGKYYVVIKSHYLVFYPASKHEQGTERDYKYVDLLNSHVDAAEEDAGFVFTVSPKTGRGVTFVADNEKDRTRFIKHVREVQVQAPGLEDFTPLSLIGKGHYGRVILVKANSTSKILNPKAKARDQLYAMKEMKLGQTKPKVIQTERMVMEWSGDHPFVLGLDYAFGHGRSMFLVTKFMKGGDLFLHMQKRGGRFQEEAIRFYAAELILALEHLHSVHIIHRDIKPENVLLDEDGHIKLADMGLAKRLESHFDRTRTLCGTDAYLSPEQVTRHPAGHGKMVDFWQLGCLLYELSAGHPPFYLPKATDRQIHHRILYSTPRYPPSLSSEFKDLLIRLLLKKPADRLGSNGFSELKTHKFFKDVDWDDIRLKQVAPPIVPEDPGSNYINNFDQQFTQQSCEIKTNASSALSRDFVGFEYVASPVQTLSPDRASPEHPNSTKSADTCNNNHDQEHYIALSLP